MEAKGSEVFSECVKGFYYGGQIGEPKDLDASLLTQSDGYATGLVVYTLKEAGVAPSRSAIRKGTAFAIRAGGWRLAVELLTPATIRSRTAR